MTRLNATSLDQIRFRQNDSEQTHIQKLEFLRSQVAAGLGVTRTLYMSITDGLPAADPDEPLLRVRMRNAATIGEIEADAGDAATGTVAFRLKKNGADNGEIEFTGTTGTPTITDALYPDGSLLELYPPLVADATLDDVSISIPLSVG